MAALDRPTEATYAIHENVTVDTTDREDHTFCGIMFPVKCKNTLPVDHIVINKIAVRGRLGPLTVWVTKNNDEVIRAEQASRSARSLPQCASPHLLGLRATRRSPRLLSHPGRFSALVNDNGISSSSKTKSFSMKQKYWTKLYEKTHAPSYREYCALDLSDNPIVLRPDDVRGVYIHSTLPGDEAIVYDNKQKRITHDDAFISVLPGRAHVSESPFGTMPIWGWGNAWRDNREFVGRISYGVVYRLWNPREYAYFGHNFRAVARTLFACQRRWESPFSRLPDECIFYILNMCRWDWVNDTPEGMREVKKQRRLLLQQQQEQQTEQEQQQQQQQQQTDQEQQQQQQTEQPQKQESSICDAAEECKVADETKVGVVTCSVALPTEEAEDDDSEEYFKEEAVTRQHIWDDDDDDDDDVDDDAGDEEEDWDEVDEDWDEEEEEDDDDYDGFDSSVFYYHDYDEDDDEDNEAEVLQEAERRRSWLRSQFARIHVLRALSNLTGPAVLEVADDEE